jgi:hypothetical protein
LRWIGMSAIRHDGNAKNRPEAAVRKVCLRGASPTAIAPGEYMGETENGLVGGLTAEC